MLTKRENWYLINRNQKKLVYDASHVFTDAKIPYLDTVTILNNGSVPLTVAPRDVVSVFTLNKGVQYIEWAKDRLSVDFIKHLNAIVAYDSVYPGQLAQQRMVISHVKYRPPLPSEDRLKQLISNKVYLPADYLTRGLSLMLALMRNQFFWNGNKRTAWLTANYYLLQHHAGIVDIPAKKKKQWDALLMRFYYNDNSTDIIHWLKQNCTVTKL